MKKKTLLASILTGAMILSLFGCGTDKSEKKESNGSIFDQINQESSTFDEDLDDRDDNEDDVESSNAEKDNKGSVYFLNFSPQLDQEWKDLAKTYSQEAGVEVLVLTAASGTYETTLASEITKDIVPTLFHVSGTHTLDTWKDYCYDLSKSDVYDELTSDSYALKDGKKVLGLSYSIESYGIIVNKTLLKKAGYTIDNISSFDDLKDIAEDITARSSELGFSAFTSAGMDSSSDWRFKTHLANVPLYFEFQNEGIGYSKTIKGTYLDNYRKIFDLYINNSTCNSKDLATMTGDDARNEFLGSKAVFYQNGTWEYGSLKQYFADDELAMIPIYTGAGKESKQGLCTGSEHYWCVNKEASEEDIEATLDFLYWVVTSEEGTTVLSDEMGLTIPYKEANESTNLFVRQDAEYTEDGKIPVTWNFNAMPSEHWKNNLGDALVAYAADPTDANWDKVVHAFIDNWADEWSLKN